MLVKPYPDVGVINFLHFNRDGELSPRLVSLPSHGRTRTPGIILCRSCVEITITFAGLDAICIDFLQAILRV